VTSDARRDPRRDARAGLVGLEGQLNKHEGAPHACGAPLLRLRPEIELFPSESGELYLLETGTERTVVIRDPDAADRALLDALASGPTAVDPDQRERLEPLLAAGLLLHCTPAAPLAPGEAVRFDRQLPYFAGYGDPADVQRRLRAASVLVLGCGGLGTWALAALACSGVGRLVLVDDDAVDVSNLNRQFLYGIHDVGRLKVEACAAWVRGFDPAIAVHTVAARVEGERDVERLLRGVQAVVLAADWPPYELARWVNAACLRAGVPFIAAGQQPPLAKIGPTYLTPGGPCFACHERALERDFPRYPELAEHRRRHPAPATTLGPASAAIGGLLATEVVHLLIGAPPATAGCAVLLDLRTLTVRHERVERDPGCPLCEGA
jgi:bacteriocin biosynthesis cyclodehydratase domain-containing protein